MSSLPPAMFLPDGDGFVGTELARGPWDEGAAHGGPVAALIGREVERHDPDAELVTVRYTIELLRPVPLAGIRLETETVRPGKRVRLIQVSVRDGSGVEAARATVLRILRATATAPAVVHEGPPAFSSPEEAVAAPSLMPGRVGITHGVELLSAGGTAVEPGPATYWFRVHVPLVVGEPITPLTRALVAADFGNGISSETTIDEHVFINPDLTVHLFREPEGEWIANDAATWLQPGGAAVATATLWDRTGVFGQATQSLYVAGR